MDGQEIIQESQGNSILLKLGSKAGTLADLDLPIGLKFMLDNIRREWSGLGQDRLEQLLEYVYNTAPMLEVTKNHKSDEKVRLNLLAENEKLVNELLFDYLSEGDRLLLNPRNRVSLLHPTVNFDIHNRNPVS